MGLPLFKEGKAGRRSTLRKSNSTGNVIEGIEALQRDEEDDIEEEEEVVVEVDPHRARTINEMSTSVRWFQARKRASVALAENVDYQIDDDSDSIHSEPEFSSRSFY
jgi:hypothetical protein